MKPENKKPHVVLDTNILISAAILPNSASRKAFDFAAQQFQIASSKEILEELIAVIDRPHFDKYFHSANTRFDFLMLIARVSEYFQPQMTITDCRDPDDNKILELAIDINAKIIVSGDDDLLVLHPYKGINIIKPQEFLSSFAQSN